MRKMITLAGALALTLTSTAAFAEYPERPIVVINPNSAGGGTDVGIRTWQPYVEACIGNGATLVPTAMPGAASAVGNAALAAAAADGYTVGMTNLPNLITNKFSKPELPGIDDFVFLGNIIGVRSTINVRKDSEFKTLKEALDKFKATGGTINVGMGGVGADDHLVGLQFQKMTGIPFNFIPFGSGADSRNALLGGQVDIAFMSNVEAAGFREEVRPLAVAAVERTDLFPEAPTFKEEGFDLVGGSTHVIAAPKGFPEEAAAKWRECVQTAAKDPKFLEDAKKRNLSLAVMTAEEADKFVRDQAKLLADLWASDPWIKP
jgi:tripartite-type tricarboxylate transporter receptor subunit TctC